MMMFAFMRIKMNRKLHREIYKGNANKTCTSALINIARVIRDRINKAAPLVSAIMPH